MPGANLQVSFGVQERSTLYVVVFYPLEHPPLSEPMAEIQKAKKKGHVILTILLLAKCGYVAAAVQPVENLRHST